MIPAPQPALRPCPGAAAITMPHRLLVFPDDTAQSLIDALTGAARSINIRMFLFTDPAMLAGAAARQRSVQVRVMLSPQRATAPATTGDAREAAGGRRRGAARPSR